MSRSRHIGIPLSILLLLLLLPAVSARAGTAEKVRALLETNDYRERSRLYSELASEVGPRDLPILVKALDKVTPGQPAFYLIYLMERADPDRAMPYLRRAAHKHPHCSVRCAAAQALARRQDTSWVDPFLKAIQNREISATDRSSLVNAFSALRDSGPIDRLLELVFVLHGADPPDPEADRIGESILRLLSYRQTPRFTEKFRKAFAMGGPRTRSAAAAALIRLGDPAALETVTKDYREGRITDSDMIRNLTFLGGLKGDKVIGLLRLILEKSKLKSLTLMALRYLGEARDRESIRRLKALVDDPDGDVAAAAATALGRMESETLIPFWTHRLKHEDAVQRVRAAAALVGLDRFEGKPVLLEVLQDDKADLSAREEAAKALAFAASPEVVEPLIRALEVRDAGVRSAAWIALGKVFNALFPYRGPNLNALGYDPRGDPEGSKDTILVLRSLWNRKK
ncbi:MAG: HEAT repeat domain-containing protein [Planctomycetota bacterium]|jgi:HEAT repeat protein